jgi:hypothetical protein
VANVRGTKPTACALVLIQLLFLWLQFLPCLPDGHESASAGHTTAVHTERVVENSPADHCHDHSSVPATKAFLRVHVRNGAASPSDFDVLIKPSSATSIAASGPIAPLWRDPGRAPASGRGLLITLGIARI